MAELLRARVFGIIWDGLLVTGNERVSTEDTRRAVEKIAASVVDELAAPDLLAACKHALDYLRIYEQEVDEDGRECGDVLRAAIARAEGREGSHNG